MMLVLWIHPKSVIIKTKPHFPSVFCITTRSPPLTTYQSNRIQVGDSRKWVVQLWEQMDRKLEIDRQRGQAMWSMSLIGSNREILTEPSAADVEYHRTKWTLFGNEAEKMEIAVIRNQRLLRKRIDKLALRQQVRVSNSPGLWVWQLIPLTPLGTQFNKFKDLF